MGKLDVYANVDLLSIGAVKEYVSKECLKSDPAFLAELDRILKDVIKKSISYRKTRTRRKRGGVLAKGDVVIGLRILSFETTQNFLNKTNYKLPLREQKMTPQDTNPQN